MAAAIRAAEPGEEAKLLAMYEWLFAPPGAPPPRWDTERAAVALREAIDSPASTVLVAEDDGAPAGVCTVYVDLNSVRYGRRAWVEDLVVDPERRSRGLGKLLLDAAKDWARGRGATHLELDSGEGRLDAHRFYEREQPDGRSVAYAWEL